MWTHAGIQFAPGWVMWSLADTAESIRADEQLEAGLPNEGEHDHTFYELVKTATRSEETARRQLKARILIRRERQANDFGNKAGKV